MTGSDIIIVIVTVATNSAFELDDPAPEPKYRKKANSNTKYITRK